MKIRIRKPEDHNDSVKVVTIDPYKRSLNFTSLGSCIIALIIGILSMLDVVHSTFLIVIQWAFLIFSWISLATDKFRIECYIRRKIAENKLKRV